MISTMTTFNSKQVKKTLELTILILNKYRVEYRVLGSVVTAAIIGKQHRKLNDIDFLIDSSRRKEILEEFYKVGYYHRGGRFAFARKYLNLDSLENNNYLEAGMFWGSWDNDGFTIGSKSNGITIDQKALVKHKYKLHGVNFVGLPKEVISRGLMASSGNPKRKLAVRFFRENNILPMKNDYIHPHIFGFKVDFIYYLAMHLLNEIGFIRVKLNKPFDPWR